MPNYQRLYQIYKAKYLNLREMAGGMDPQFNDDDFRAAAEELAQRLPDGSLPAVLPAGSAVAARAPFHAALRRERERGRGLPAPSRVTRQDYETVYDEMGYRRGDGGIRPAGTLVDVRARNVAAARQQRQRRDADADFRAAAEELAQRLPDGSLPAVLPAGSAVGERARFHGALRRERERGRRLPEPSRVTGQDYEKVYDEMGYRRNDGGIRPAGTLVDERARNVAAARQQKQRRDADEDFRAAAEELAQRLPDGSLPGVLPAGTAVGKRARFHAELRRERERGRGLPAPSRVTGQDYETVYDEMGYRRDDGGIRPAGTLVDERARNAAAARQQRQRQQAPNASVPPNQSAR
jgi:hypothetical protein